MKKILLLSLLLLGVDGLAELQAAPALSPVSVAKAYPGRLQRTMRRLHRQAQARARKNRYQEQ